MNIVLGIFIGWENRVTFGQNVSRLGFVMVKNLKNHQKRVTFGQNVSQSTIFKNFFSINCVTISQCRRDINFNLEKFICVTISVP